MKDFTDITVLLDRSGSMASVKTDTIGGFNTFVKQQKKVGDNAALTLVQFDTVGTDYVYEGTPIKKVEPMTDKSYRPRGGTPLLDALGDAIERTGSRLKAIPEDDRPDKVVFVVITDGQENSSHHHTKASVKALVDRQTTKYSWQFVYLGANQDAFSEAGNIGFNPANVANYTPNNTSGTWTATSANVSTYRSGAGGQSLGYSPKQRKDLTKTDDTP